MGSDKILTGVVCFVLGFVVATFMWASVVERAESRTVSAGVFTHSGKAYRLTPLEKAEAR